MWGLVELNIIKYTDLLNSHRTHPLITGIYSEWSITLFKYFALYQLIYLCFEKKDG